MRYRKHLQGCLEANSEIGTILLNLISDENEPDGYLRKIAESGCLGQILPEWNQVEVHPQFDRYHAYTVGEHTIRVIRALHDLESGARMGEAPLASRCLASVDLQDRQSLYVAAFLHDIGKGYGGSHSEKVPKLRPASHLFLGLMKRRAGLSFGLCAVTLFCQMPPLSVTPTIQRPLTTLLRLQRAPDV